MMLWKVIFVCLFVRSALCTLSADEIKKKIQEYEEALAKIEVQCALDEFYDILESAEFFQNVHKKCAILSDFEDSTDAPEEYDFIIVGGGNSGTLMARRLSEESSFSVAVLEKGYQAGPMSKIPILNPYIYFTNYTENKCFEPEDDVGLAMEDHRIVLVHGMAMGGSSIMDDMIVSKGHKSYLDSWGTVWCESAAKYFTKSEKAKLTGDVDTANHNFDGPQIRSDAYLSPLGEAFIKCGNENGLPEIDDTGDFETGVCRVKTLTNNGRRENHAESFLTDEVLARPNLCIKQGVTVYKILINEYMRAYGVQYVSNGKKYTVLAKKEIILSLSQFHTPQLLMLSGIGPKEHLEEIGIKCILDLPVGQTLHDVISYIGLLYEVNSEAPSCLQDIINKPNAELFIKNGTGPFASSNSIESAATVMIDSDVPNVKIQLVNRGWALDEGKALRQTVGITKEFYKSYFKHLEGKRVIMVVPSIPAESSGRIRLKSNNPFEDPVIFGNYYSNPKDRKLMISAIKYTLEFMKCESFKKFNLTFCDKPVPGCEHKKGYAYFECIIKYLTCSYQDQTGTCKMGDESDPTAVVDKDLRLHGIYNIRVIGSQVMPNSMIGGANGVSTMMVERVADIIKADCGITPEKYCPA